MKITQFFSGETNKHIYIYGGQSKPNARRKIKINETENSKMIEKNQ